MNCRVEDFISLIHKGLNPEFLSIIFSKNTPSRLRLFKTCFCPSKNNHLALLPVPLFPKLQP